ncbi:MAG: AMIN domain-containing protein [Vicinamibacterales bacterium]
MPSMFAFWAAAVVGASGPVTGVSVLPAAERTQIVIAVAGEVEYREFTMEGPNRLVVDILGSTLALPQDEYPSINRGGVLSLRTSQYSPDVVRVVVELQAMVPYEVRQGEGGLRITLDNPTGRFTPWTSALGVGPSAPARAPAPSLTRAAAPAPLPAQEAPRITISFENTPIQEVASAFADFAGRSIVLGAGVAGAVTAQIDNQPWDQAFRVILEANGLRAIEMDTGIIRVDNTANLNTAEGIEPLVTNTYRLNFGNAAELVTAITPMKSARGQIAASAGSNAVIVTDVQRVQDAISNLLQTLDIRTPQVQIQAKIVFVNRTDLNEFGVTYDLKDSRGNQINAVSPGGADANGNGMIDLPDEQVDVGTNVYALGGNSVAALGNANARVIGPTLTLLSSLIIGRHTLVNFIEALQSVNLSDIQAVPSVTVMDNQEARIQVGQDTPLRVLDAGAAGSGTALPTATVQTRPTGVILTVTPHVTASEDIVLNLNAERSDATLASSDVGFVFNTQNARTRVLVRDGETTVIGGLTVTEKTDVRSGIPILMDLPLLGALFRVDRKQSIQRDLIILVTPHIVRN